MKKLLLGLMIMAACCLNMTVQAESMEASTADRQVATSEVDAKGHCEWSHHHHHGHTCSKGGNISIHQRDEECHHHHHHHHHHHYSHHRYHHCN